MYNYVQSLAHVLAKIELQKRKIEIIKYTSK